MTRFPDWETPETVAGRLPRLLDDAEAAVAALEASSPADFESLVWGLDDAVRELTQTWGRVSHMLQVMNSPEWRKVEETFQMKMVLFSLRCGQSPMLYAAAKTALALESDPLRRRVLEKSVQSAELAGVGLDGAAKVRFNEIQTRLSKLGSDFANAVIDATAAYKLEKDGTKVVRVKDYYSVPQDHRTAPEGKYKVACVFNDFSGRQKILYVQKDPTAFTEEKKSVNTQDKERAKLIKETEKKIKDWESENVHDVLESRTWNLDDAHFAAVVFAVAASYGYINASNFYSVDGGLRNLARMVWRNDFDGLERRRYIDELSRMIIGDESSHLKTLAVFEESNYDIDPELKKLLQTR